MVYSLKSYFRTDAVVLFGAVFIPLENSRYNSECIMEQFYFEVDENSRSFKHLIMMDDFNTRTSNKEDFAEIDEVIFDQIDVDPKIFLCQSLLMKLQVMVLVSKEHHRMVT